MVDLSQHGSYRFIREGCARSKLVVVVVPSQNLLLLCQVKLVIVVVVPGQNLLFFVVVPGPNCC